MSDLYSQYFPETKVASASTSGSGDLFSQYFPEKKPEPMQLPFVDDARQAAEEEFNALQDSDSALPFRVTSTISGGYGMLDNALNFLPSIAQQAAGVPANQRKVINLQKDFEDVVPIARQMHQQYPKAFEQRAGMAAMAAPAPSLGKRATLAGEVAAQSAMGAGMALGSLPGSMAKAGRDVTLPDIALHGLLGGGLGGVVGLGAGLVGAGIRALKPKSPAVIAPATPRHFDSTIWPDAATENAAIEQALSVLPRRQGRGVARKEADALDATLKGNIAKADKAVRNMKQRKLVAAMEAEVAWPAQRNVMAEVLSPNRKMLKPNIPAKSKPYALHAVVNQKLDAEMKANIAAAEKRLAVIRAQKQLQQEMNANNAQAEARVLDAQMKGVNQVMAGKQQELDEVTNFILGAKTLHAEAEKAQRSAKAMAEAAQAKLDSELQAQELLDNAVAFPLAFKKFKDGKVTWTADGLTDAKLAEYAETLAKKAEGAKGAAKTAFTTRAEVINQCIAMRASRRQEGKLVTVPDAVPEVVEMEVPLPPVPTASNAAIREAVIATNPPHETYTPQQVGEALEAKLEVDGMAKSRGLLPEAIGTQRGLEGYPVNELVEDGVITPTMADTATRLASKALEVKEIKLAKQLISNEIVGTTGGTVTLFGHTHKYTDFDKAGEWELSFNRKASEGLAQQRLGKDKVKGTRNEYLRATVGDATKNKSLLEAVKLTLPKGTIEEMAAFYANLAEGLKVVEKEFKALKSALLKDFVTVKTATNKPHFGINVVAKTLPDGTPVHVNIEHVPAHEVRDFTDAAKAEQFADTIDAYKQSGDAWLRNPTKVTAARKAQIIAGMTSLGSFLHAEAAHAANAGSAFMDVPATWASMGMSPEAVVASLVPAGMATLGKLGRPVARNILEGELGNWKNPVFYPFLFKAIRTADIYRNTYDRVAAITRIVADSEGVLERQLAAGRELFRMSRHLDGVSDEAVATCMQELRSKRVLPDEALNGNGSWGALPLPARETLLEMRQLQNELGATMTGFADNVNDYIAVANEVLLGREPLQALHQMEVQPSIDANEVRKKLELLLDLQPSLAYQCEQLNPVGVVSKLLESGANEAMKNFNQNVFGKKNLAFQIMTIFDQLTLGASYAGARNLLAASTDRLANRELAAALKAIHFVGERAGEIDMQRAGLARPQIPLRQVAGATVDAVGHLFPSYDRERVNAEELALAIAYRYYGKNKRYLQGVTRQQFALEIFGEGNNIHPAAMEGVWNEIVQGLSEVHAVDPMRLNTNILNESTGLAKIIGWFAKQPAREARLVMNYSAKGDWGALYTFFNMKMLVAGSAALPAEMLLLLSLSDPDAAEGLRKGMQAWSVYRLVDKEGTMSDKLAWSNFWFVNAGRNMPIQVPAEKLVQMLQQYYTKMANGDEVLTPDDRQGLMSAAVPLLPGGDRIPVSRLVSAKRAFDESYNDKPLKGYPDSPVGTGFSQPLFNLKEEKTVDEVYEGWPQAVGRAVHVGRAFVAPGSSRFSEDLTDKFRQETMGDFRKNQVDALAKFFGQQVVQK